MLAGKRDRSGRSNAERPSLLFLASLVQSGQYLEDQIREAAWECFDDLGLEPPQQSGG